MSDTSNTNRPEIPPDGLFGALPEGERDSTLEPTAPVVSHRRGAPVQDAAPVESEAPLELPDDAVIAMRRSGGLQFSSRTVIVYRDGRVLYGPSEDVRNGAGATGRKISRAGVSALRRTLSQIDFFNMPASFGRHSPDTNAFELAARLRRRTNHIEVFEGDIPDELAPLVRQLQQFMWPAPDTRDAARTQN